MANTNPRIIITELDPDSIKANLITFLKSQAEFKDYNFEGSGLNILLDILSYSTHYNAYYINMAANERFMDTALLSDSVMSKAKELGYIPNSRNGSVANVNITVTPPNTFTSLSLTIPRYASFLGSPVDGTNYTFSTQEASTATRANANASFVFSGVNLVQGRPLTYSFGETNLDTNPTGRYILPDTGIDTSTLTVLVQHSSSNTLTDVYERADDITEIDNESLVYFLEPGIGGTFVLQFGDDVTGKKIQNGNIVIVNYVVTDGILANGSETFSYYKNGNIPASSTVVVRTNASAAGGSQEPDIETIRFNALRAYSRQNRAVTLSDYETLLKQEYPFADSISVWGGEDNNPPQYGSVFISIKPKTGYTLSISEKERIVKDILKKKNVMTVLPSIIDPSYLYIKCDLEVNYDARKIGMTEEELKQIIRNAIFSYNSTSLDEFNTPFRLSSLYSVINDSHQSILGSDMDITLEKRETVELGVSRSYTITFGVELRRGVLNKQVYSTTPFYYVDNSGVTRLAYIEETPLSSTGISSIEIRSPGSNYTSQANITITGDAPAGLEATAHPVIVNGQVQSVVLDKSGGGYSSATVTVNDTNGYGAEVYPILSALRGELRIVYYQNGEKVVLKDAAGVIKYDTGIITLDNFQPISLTGETIQEFRFVAQSEKDTVYPSQNIIIVIDQNDETSVTLNLVAE